MKKCAKNPSKREKKNTLIMFGYVTIGQLDNFPWQSSFLSKAFPSVDFTKSDDGTHYGASFICHTSFHIMMNKL